MAIRTFDHSGFIVEDIPRAHEFYEALFGARPLFMANLKTRTYTGGWPIISFVEMGKHRFELCLARHPLPPAEASRPIPRIGFAVSRDQLAKLPERLAELRIAVTPVPALPAGLGISECLRFHDPDGNIVELAVWDGNGHASGDVAGKGAVQVTDVCHVALEVSDLALAEKFYTEALGLTLVNRDAGELGSGRAILKNETGQLLFLEAVAALSERSLFCGPDPSTAPKVGSGHPHAGAHIAVSVADDNAYRVMEAKLRTWNVATDGDVRKAERPTGELSEYFYDPSGNRLQLIVVNP